MKNLALIVAAGGGKRMGSEIPKQYLPLGNSTVLARSIEAFLKHPQIDSVRVVIAAGDERYQALGFNDAKLLPPVIGGAERQDSVRLGLQSLKDLKPKNVLIHDAARPYVSAEVIDNVLKGLDKHMAVVPLIDLKDSARYEGKVIDREELKLVQTPQGFDYQAILKAHQAAKGKYTDDAQVAEAGGVKINFVAGAEKNRKITTMGDLNNTPGFRTGTGFDVHEFETGTHLTICGVKIPHSHQLKGHSDADVGLHALTDAILGAIGQGDIGEHFPALDPKWKNADSVKFVEHALQLVKSKNGEIGNVDITIICEEPKLTPYKPQMKKRVAEILKIDADCVNIKATTTEKLGFTGRKEGIAAQAIATIRFLR
jgi:2-C-methyl-D-erythritol 4-phosphate cytidylyltransferase/2-C-methyl-D-erythritol 2,4-cyclodiphosphate synthase